MKLDIERDQLLKPLSRVSGVVERRQTLPILANVYVKLEDSTLTLIGTDLEVEISESITGVQGKKGEITVTARKLMDICRALPETATINLDTDGSLMTVQAGRSKFSLQTLPSKDFPKIDTDKWEERISLPAKEFRQLLEKTSFSMANQDVRYYLNGLLLEISGDSLRAVATDGHRLAKSDLTLKGNKSDFRQIIVPRKAVMELIRLLQENEDKVVVEVSPNHIRVNTGATIFTSKLIDGRFPDYEAVLSPLLTTVVSVERVPFLECLARTAILTNEKFRGVRLNVEKSHMLVSAHNPEQEEASDELMIDYDEDAIEIGFNVTYMMDALKALVDEKIELRLRDNNSSCTISSPGDENTVYLVMPMRL